MSDLPAKWKSLPTYQKIKYIAEIIAILGGLVLISVNVFQLRLLSESNSINRALIRSTFPLEIESGVIEYSDKQPIVLKIKLTNIVNQRFSIQPWLPEMVPSGSKATKSDLKEITTKIYRTKSKTPVVTSPYENERKVTLKPSESCILEMSIELDIPSAYAEKDIFKYKPENAAFIIIPMTLFGVEQQSSRTLLVSLSRDKKKSLIVSSDILRITDNDTILQIVGIERSRMSVPEWD